MIPCKLICLVVLVCVFHQSFAPPITQKPEVDRDNDILSNIGVEYKRYLQEVVSALESDQEFRNRLEKAEEADLRTGKIAQELQYVRHDVRSKLDELKRAELERLRHYIRRQAELTQGLDPDHLKQVKHNDALGHIDHQNPHSFEIADLEKLIAKTTQHLAEADRKRREEFKQYELQKEFERNLQRESLSSPEREKFDQKMNNIHKAKDQRARELHHPASKKQLEEVWQYQDHMSVRDFDPKTFFFLHDVDGNGFLDHEEVKALFVRELQKLYNMGFPGDDLRERSEEMERMREHVFTEADTNRDGVISLQEWLDLTRRPDFNADSGWESLEPKREFTPEEYHEFERQRQKEIEALIAQGKLPPKSKEQLQWEAENKVELAEQLLRRTQNEMTARGTKLKEMGIPRESLHQAGHPPPPVPQQYIPQQVPQHVPQQVPQQNPHQSPLNQQQLYQQLQQQQQQIQLQQQQIQQQQQQLQQKQQHPTEQQQAPSNNQPPAAAQNMIPPKQQSGNNNILNSAV